MKTERGERKQKKQRGKRERREGGREGQGRNGKNEIRFRKGTPKCHKECTRTEISRQNQKLRLPDRTYLPNSQKAFIKCVSYAAKSSFRRSTEYTPTV